MRTVTRICTAVVAATVVALAGCTASESPRLAVFDEPATPQDALPDEVELGDEADAYDEIRYIGEAGDALVYAATTPRGDPWCALVVIPGEAEDDAGDTWMAGSSCANGADFVRRGIESSVASGTRTGTALLLPDDFAGELDEAEWRVVGPNLAVPATS